VKNTGKETMYFSIGGHPAFACPEQPDGKQTDYYLHFDGTDKITSRMIREGVATDHMTEYILDDGYLKISEDLFDNDALVVEGNQTQAVSLCRPDKTPYITLHFDAPLFGVWSVPGKAAPFVCIEPWYGRCDHENFEGTLEQREWSNTLEPEGVFEVSYDIALG
jgi:galactose mutarotase-like enzyme